MVVCMSKEISAEVKCMAYPKVDSTSLFVIVSYFSATTTATMKLSDEIVVTIGAE